MKSRWSLVQALSKLLTMNPVDYVLNLSLIPKLSFSLVAVFAEHLFMSRTRHHHRRGDREQEERNASGAAAFSELQRNAVRLLQSRNGHEHVRLVGVEEWKGDDERGGKFFRRKYLSVHRLSTDYGCF